MARIRAPKWSYAPVGAAIRTVAATVRAVGLEESRSILCDIGSAVARRAHGFGMDVFAVDKRTVECPPEGNEVWGLDRLDELLGISDWFVVTAPLTEESRGMIDRRRIPMATPSASSTP